MQVVQDEDERLPSGSVAEQMGDAEEERELRPVRVWLLCAERGFGRCPRDGVGDCASLALIERIECRGLSLEESAQRLDERQIWEAAVLVAAAEQEEGVAFYNMAQLP